MHYIVAVIFTQKVLKAVGFTEPGFQIGVHIHWL